MVLTRLLHLPSMSLETFEVSEMPQYLAVSHAWSESLFPISNLQDNTVESSDGLAMLQRAREQRGEISGSLYAWIDTWCIDQSDPEDKSRQIPVMGDIYRQARAVVVIVRHRFSFTQADWDITVENLREPMICAYDSSSKYTPAAFDLYRSDRYTQDLEKGLRILLEISNLEWMKRVWTAQEYVLAATVIFIGEDLRSFQCSPTDMNTLLLIQQLKTNDTMTEYGNLGTLNNIWNRRDDLTLVMDLAKDRVASYKVDAIYGLMGASEVVIPPLQSLALDEVWNAWLKEAINAGHLLWIMLPLYNGPTGDSCLLPSFQDRHISLSNSQIRSAQPLGPVKMTEGSVTFTGYFAGVCRITAYLGDIEGPSRDVRSELVNRVQGDLDLARQICAATSSGNNSKAETERLAHWSRQFYRWRKAGNVPRVTESRYKQAVRELGKNEPLTLNGLPQGNYYLAVIKSPLKATPVLLRVEGSIPEGRLVAVDIDAKLGAAQDEERHVLMILSVPRGGERPGRTLHKVGITSVVFIPNDRNLERARELNGHVFDAPLETFVVGGRSCWSCSKSS